uniref:Putative secreted protein n=1 Tax=Anopheles darlingi TaxID=43151 RepID=A0A2M4DRP6_ANODA
MGSKLASLVALGLHSLVQLVVVHSQSAKHQMPCGEEQQQQQQQEALARIHRVLLGTVHGKSPLTLTGVSAVKQATRPEGEHRGTLSWGRQDGTNQWQRSVKLAAVSVGRIRDPPIWGRLAPWIGV